MKIFRAVARDDVVPKFAGFKVAVAVRCKINETCLKVSASKHKDECT